MAPRRYTLEQEEFVRKCIEIGVHKDQICEGYRSKFHDGEFANGQLSYLKTKNKLGTLG
jgi:hypothetical protein